MRTADQVKLIQRLIAAISVFLDTPGFQLDAELRKAMIETRAAAEQFVEDNSDAE